MQLGEFARDRRGPRPKLDREVGEHLGETPRRLVEDRAFRHGGERVDRSRRADAEAAEASKKKRSVGRPATQSAASAAEGPGAAMTAKPSSTASATSL